MDPHTLNPLQLPDADHFLVGVSDLGYFDNYAGRTENGAIMLCRKGHAEVVLNDYHGTVRRNNSVMILPESRFSITSRSADFQVEFFSFTPQLFAEAAFRLEIDFMRILHAYPVNTLSRDGVQGMESWLKMLGLSYRDRENRFRNTIVRNRLQNALLEACDKVMRTPEIKMRADTSTLRRSELFNRFVVLVSHHSSTEREVAFYAKELCISTRYLSSIVHEVSGRTAKSIIDHSVITEIKLLLRTTDLSVQEIAYRMHFPDQSYLGRFFRKHTGESPSAYRLQQQ